MDLNIHPPLPQKKDFRIGILGSGFIVSDCHLVSYRKAGFNPIAIASRSRENAAEGRRAPRTIPKVHDRYEQLLDDLTYRSARHRRCRRTRSSRSSRPRAPRGKTVKGILAQKPLLGMNYAGSARSRQNAANRPASRSPSTRTCATTSRCAPPKLLLTNGTIGEPVFATIDMRGVPHFMPWQKELGWVTLRVMSIHHIDCFRYWFGDPEGIYCSVRNDPRTKFPHTDGICTYVLEYKDGLRCVVIDDVWTGPAKEGCPADIGIQWRIEGLKGLAIGDIGWCKDHLTRARRAFVTRPKATKRFMNPNGVRAGSPTPSLERWGNF